MQIKQEILEHYKGIDFSLWEKSINLYFDKLRKLKTDKARRVWSLKLYSTYLQVIEVFCINVFAITENELWGNLFLGNFQLREKIEQRFYMARAGKDVYSYEFAQFLLKNWVFGMRDKSKINNLGKKTDIYSRMLKEAIEDYLKDYDLLNAYKHGFRVKSNGKSNLTMKADKENAPVFQIAEYNASISYLKKKEGLVTKEDLSFNWQRVVQKSYFLLNMLENVQKVLLYDKQEVQHETLTVEDELGFAKHYGSARFTQPLFFLKHLKKPKVSKK